MGFVSWKKETEMRTATSRSEAGTKQGANLTLVHGVGAAMVTQKEMRAYRKLEADIAQKQEEMDRLAGKIMSKLKAGAGIEDGPRVARIHHTKGRRTPKYKERLEELYGKDYVQGMIEETEPGAGSDKLIVENIKP